MKRHISELNIVHIILLALLLRVVWMMYAQPTPVSDFAEYKLLAANLIKYHQFGYPTPTAYRLPGYPLFLALFLLLDFSDVGLSFINILLSLLIVYFVFIIAIQLTKNHNLGLCAGFLAGIYPIYVFFSPILASEHLFTAVLYISLILILSNARGKKQILTRFFAGILLGIATIIRGEAIYYIPIITLIIFSPDEKMDKNQENTRLSHKILTLCVLLIAWCVSTIPWYIRNQIVIGPGSGLGTSGGIMFYYGHHNENQEWNDLLSVENLGSGEINRSATAYQKGLSYIFETPIGLQIKDKFIESLRLFAPNDYPIFWSVALPRVEGGTTQEKFLPGKKLFVFLTISGYLIIGTLALISLLFLKYYPPRFWITNIGFIFMNLLGYAVLFAATSRYRYTIEGFLIILAAGAIWKFHELLIQRKSANEVIL